MINREPVILEGWKSGKSKSETEKLTTEPVINIEPEAELRKVSKQKIRTSVKFMMEKGKNK